jgi:hypothetical protein
LKARGTWVPRREVRGKTHAFEGALPESQYEDVIAGLKKILDPETDGVRVLFRKMDPETDGIIEVSAVRREDNTVLESQKVNVGTIPVPVWLQGIGAWKKKELLYTLFCAL